MQRVKIRVIRNAEFIEATLQAVHKHGLGAVTMSEIAQQTGATAASINYYFGSKERLMEATMRHLLGLLRTAVVRNLTAADTPLDRLYATLDANFDDHLFTAEKCSVWVQFWSAAPYAPALARLQRLNRARVASHFR
ncbi:MAG: transcriptional regulator BetI, partial [Marinovum sp.]|nr:transcriptional regulator BetI [Marinovum sp.]